MIVLLKKHATDDEIKNMAEDFDGLYIKVVVDVERKKWQAAENDMLMQNKLF